MLRRMQTKHQLCLHDFLLLLPKRQFLSTPIPTAVQWKIHLWEFLELLASTAVLIKT